jgi:hypothetical protein
MTSVARVSEEASMDLPSPEIQQAIFNLALIAPELRMVERKLDLSDADKNRIDQIESVLRARDARFVDRRPVR